MSAPRSAHLMPLHGDWAVWRKCAVRGAGLPVRYAAVFSDERVASAADGSAADGSSGYEAEYAAAWQRVGDGLGELARDPLFREAIAWQNPEVIAHNVDRIAAAPDFGGAVPTSKLRKNLATVAAYAQRYLLKNDTIGFFGPVGWASWSEAAQALRAVPGPRLLANRTVYFEVWAIDALARALLPRRALPLRRSPEVFFDGDRVVTAAGKRVELSKAEAGVLAACEGTTTEHWLSDAADAVEDLCERGLLLRDADIPYCARPEERLLELVAGLPESEAKARAVAVVGRVLAARDAVAAAAGKPDELLAAMVVLREVFTEATSSAATRRDGQAYAGRTLVYEDAVRDVQIDLGQPLLSALSPPLDLLLTSARWLAAEVGMAYEARARRALDRLRDRTGLPRVPLARLMAALTPDLAFSFGRLPEVVQGCSERFQHKWMSVLRAPSGARRHGVTSDGIRERVLAEFGGAPVLWSAASQHSPDIMIAATGVEAVNEGRFLAVLGEVHIAVNTLQARVFVEQSPDPAAMLAREVSDHRAGRIIGLPAKGSRGVTSRTHPSALLAPEFTYWVMYPDPTNRPGELIPAGALTVGTNEENELTVSHVDGREFPLSEVIGESLSWVTMNAFAPIAATQVAEGIWRRPRVTVDCLVIARESWRFRASVIGWARLRSGPQRFQAARRWRREWGLPERAFYRIDAEDKPQFVDFTSVVLVDLLGREIRRLTSDGCVSLSEMLPDIGETWLADDDGNRYTSEIRMVTVDLKA